MHKIIQITSGRGPAECNFVVTNVYKKFIAFCEKHNLEVQVLETELQDNSTLIASVILEIAGNNLNTLLKEWIGTILWIGQSPFRKFHARKNWFIGCFELEMPKEEDFNIKDITYDTMRSSGSGGQHVNKVSSAVRAKHEPTGITVVAMDSRSQIQNKKIATTRLLLKLQEKADNSKQNLVQEKWTNQMAIERGNPVKTFRGEKFL